jgi:hypothetical protein
MFFLSKYYYGDETQEIIEAGRVAHEREIKKHMQNFCWFSAMEENAGRLACSARYVNYLSDLNHTGNVRVT